jgi:predicted ATPase
MLKELSISGFRGFGHCQSIRFAIPDNKHQGSGLTMITGANNAGKTTIIESIQAFIGEQPPSFSEGKRNQITDGKVCLKLIDEADKKYTVTTVPGGGSSTKKNEPFSLNPYIIPSRRAISFDFSKGHMDRNTFISVTQRLEQQRTSYLNNFQYRIFEIEQQKQAFDQMISRVLGVNFQWVIEQRDTGLYYIKYTKNGISHSTEGIGDGIWSIFVICAALFDAPEKSTIVIDEPELSVHPALQKRLMTLFLEYSTTRQIIICTHSPYFINWEAIVNGANLIRVVGQENSSACYMLQDLEGDAEIVRHHVLVLFETADYQLTHIRAVMVTPSLDIAPNSEQDWSRYIATDESAVVENVVDPNAPGNQPKRGLSLTAKAMARQKSRLRQKGMEIVEKKES